MIEQRASGNEIELACLRKDVEDWKRRASLAEAEAQRLRDSLQDRIATYHTNGVQSLEGQIRELKRELLSFRLAARAVVSDTYVLRKLVEQVR